jgi:CRP-like cAMP-binding protein
MVTARLQLLQNMAIFGGLTEETLTRILERASVIDVAKGDFFFREGDAGNSTFALEHGRVEILKSRGRREYPLRTLEAGDCFGEMALIDFCPRSASVRALDDSRAIEISPSCLRDVYSHDVEQYAVIYMNMARELSRRLRRADERLFRVRIESRIQDADMPFGGI